MLLEHTHSTGPAGNPRQMALTIAIALMLVIGLIAATGVTHASVPSITTNTFDVGGPACC